MYNKHSGALVSFANISDHLLRNPPCLSHNDCYHDNCYSLSSRVCLCTIPFLPFTGELLLSAKLFTGRDVD